MVIQCGTVLVLESLIQNTYRRKSMSAMDSDSGDRRKMVKKLR